MTSQDTERGFITGGSALVHRRADRWSRCTVQRRLNNVFDGDAAKPSARDAFRRLRGEEIKPSGSV
ncbi:hypothetical protein EYF80_036007 [Liparis tanakae]|uniref:Uncharacterized protein n=1 Tax=Liparis tanakae TaxID=230148 RepID=A0A4Z2GLX1_9TELE|nr:hypothetical protein EYF80_036007 [Liparis tanakae]